jgi:hypothetical protein
VGVIDLARVFNALNRLLRQDTRERLEQQWANAGPAALPDLLDVLQSRRVVLAPGQPR